MIDMKATIAPKSDQLNADDLINGATMTITVTQVDVKPNADQPCTIRFEGDNGKPYKPCKSMRRALIMVWGDDGQAYVGQSMTLICDPNVKWGGVAVGGLRITHMTGLTEKRVISLTATRGVKKPYSIEPLILGNPITEADWLQWVEKMDNALSVDELNIIGKSISEMSDSYDHASMARLKAYYKDRLTTLKDAPSEGGE